MILYLLVRCLSFLLQRIPLAISYPSASLAADLAFLLWRRGRANMIDNMARVLGAGASRLRTRTLARRALRNYAKYLVDFLRISNLTPQEITERVTFNQWAPFDEALAGGKGAIFVGLHMGNWDLGTGLLCLKGYAMNVVVDTFSNQRLNDFVQGQRSRLGMKTIPRESAARRVLQVLRRNEALGILMDRPSPAEAGVPVWFFGHQAFVPGGAATLALRTGARIVPTAMVRLANNRFLGLVDRCIALQPTGDDAEDVRALTQQVMESLEHWVRQYPDQWFMFRRMWPERVAAPVPAGV